MEIQSNSSAAVYPYIRQLRQRSKKLF